LSEFAPNTNSEKVIAPHKARILAIAGAIILMHAALLLIWWPHRWPTHYKWLLLPDAASAYFLLAFGLQQLNKTRSEHKHQEATQKDADT
jgi:hypothetical protein